MKKQEQKKEIRRILQLLYAKKRNIVVRRVYQRELFRSKIKIKFKIKFNNILYENDCEFCHLEDRNIEIKLARENSISFQSFSISSNRRRRRRRHSEKANVSIRRMRDFDGWYTEERADSWLTEVPSWFGVIVATRIVIWEVSKLVAWMREFFSKKWCGFVV